MARGLFSGVLWGSILSIMSLWMLSQITDSSGLNSQAPGEVADISPDAAMVNTQTDDAPETPVAESSLPAETAPIAVEPETTVADTAPEASTEPAEMPLPGDVAGNSENPVSEDSGVVVPDTETAALTNPDIVAPVSPSGDPTPTVDVQSPEPVPEPEPEPEIVVEEVVPEVVEDNTQAQITEAEPEPSAPEVPDEEIAPIAESEIAVATPPVPETVPGSDFSTPVVVETPKPVEPPSEPEVAMVEEPEPAVVSGPAVVVDRTSREPVVDEDVSEPPLEAEATGVPPETELTGPAIEIYAQAFENPDARPLMAIVLLVDGDAPDAAIPGTPLPFPVSYVVDASKNNATDIMRAFRAGGNEIAILTPLPEGAAPKDVEVAFQTYLAAVPEAVAAMDIPTAVFQSGRSVATQVAEALAASGMGMVTYSRGLNSATQVAEREGVPAALVFRVFDGNGRDAAAIKRFLDQAAFRAGQQTGVILVGQNLPETRAALLEWALGNRASTVALAPLSTVLLAQ